MANSSDLKLDLLPATQGPPARLLESLDPLFWQAGRFVIVGISNVTIDVLALNLFLLSFPTSNTNLLLLYSSVAYALGAFNSYVLNKFWTFHSRRATTGNELLRFAILNVAGILCSDCIIWLMAGILQPMAANAILWVNASKGTAIMGTAMLSYLGMRLWVFAGASRTKENENKQRSVHLNGVSSGTESVLAGIKESTFRTSRSLSVVLPAYNEETVIAETVHGIASILTPWVQDFEVIVVNDGSSDNTKAIVEHIMAIDARVRIVDHRINQGYGAARASGFRK